MVLIFTYINIHDKLKYINIQGHGVKEDLKWDAAVVLIVYIPRYSRSVLPTYKIDCSVSWTPEKE